MIILYSKVLATRLLRGILRVFYIFPVERNKIYLSSYKGTKICCNPYYIYLYLSKTYPDKFEYVWEGEESQAPWVGSRTQFVKHGSINSIKHILTSRVIFSNVGLGSFIPKRKKQIFVNTWHGGGAYKVVGVDIKNTSREEDLINDICAKQTDYFISSSRKFTEVMSQSKHIGTEKFLECGMPRNDLLINKESMDISKKVRKYFNIHEGQKIILYAPTYRGDEQGAEFNSRLDISGCLKALEERFGGKWIFFIRMHHFVKGEHFKNCIDASDYPDMQELLYVADAFITDYSSTIWDYSLTFKPGFLFVPDLKKYSQERSFYTAPETWAFPYAETNEQLQQLIKSYSETENQRKINEHHKLLGIKEKGSACEQMGNLIKEFCS